MLPFIEHFWTIRWDEANEAYGSEEVMHRPYVDVFVSAQLLFIDPSIIFDGLC